VAAPSPNALATVTHLARPQHALAVPATKGCS